MVGMVTRSERLLHTLVTPAMHYALVKDLLINLKKKQDISAQIDLWLTWDDLIMTFDSSNALHCSLVFFSPNLVVVGQFLSNLIPCVTFDPNKFSQELSQQNLVNLGHSTS